MFDDPRLQTFYQTMPARLRELVAAAMAIEAAAPDTGRRALGLIDHTSLKESAPMTGGESGDEIAALCAAARQLGTAAICVYPNQIAAARRGLAGSPVALAVVNNFPHGDLGAKAAAADARKSVLAGAEEIDTVVDYARLLAGDRPGALDKLRAVRGATRDTGVRLKTILKATVYDSHDALADAARLAIEGGCDFVKTCTGKLPLPGYGGGGPDVSNLPVIATVMQVLADSGQEIGGKWSGGIGSAVDCERVRFLSDAIRDPGCFIPERTRIGASSLAARLAGDQGSEAPLQY